LETGGDKKLEQEKRGALNLALAFPFALKHSLRSEYGFMVSGLQLSAF
jgi:predicted membrane chloride channel (bestrophin family)